MKPEYIEQDPKAPKPFPIFIAALTIFFIVCSVALLNDKVMKRNQVTVIAWNK